MYAEALPAFCSRLLVSNGAISAEAGTAEIDYDITVRIDPVARTIEGRSVITVRTSEELTLMLGRRFETMHARVDDARLDHRQLPARCVPGGLRAASLYRAVS